MAPLTELEHLPLLPLWQKVAATTFKMGDQFYNFEEFYQYKAKFASH